MSPYPSQTDSSLIVQAARTLIEAEGAERLSLARLADQLGVKAPSLYRYFSSKADLLRAVNTETITRLIRRLRDAIEANSGSPKARLLAMAAAYRDFGRAQPATYALAYSALSPEAQIDANVAEAMVLPLQALMAEISGQAHSLAALRGALALVHGFVILELAGQFRRGGDLDEAYIQAMSAYLDGWIAQAR